MPVLLLLFELGACLRQQGVALVLCRCKGLFKLRLLVQLQLGLLLLVRCFCRFGFFLCLPGLCHAPGDFSLARVDAVEDRAVEKAFQQPDQQQKVGNLRANSDPVNGHGLCLFFLDEIGRFAWFSVLAANDSSSGHRFHCIPERVGKKKNHGHDKTIDGG